MTQTEFNTLVDNEITNATEDASITPAIMGGRLKDAVATALEASAKPYKSLVFSLSFDGNGIASYNLVNDFTGSTITLTNPSAGKIRIQSDIDVFTVNTHLITTAVYQNTTPHRVVPQLRDLDELDLNIQTWDGIQTSTPYVYNQVIEIRVYE